MRDLQELKGLGAMDPETVSLLILKILKRI